MSSDYHLKIDSILRKIYEIYREINPVYKERPLSQLFNAMLYKGANDMLDYMEENAEGSEQLKELLSQPEYEEIARLIKQKFRY